MSAADVIAPSSSSSLQPDEFRQSQLSLLCAAAADSTDEFVSNRSKVDMCSIGVQTEASGTYIDLTLPLWMVSLPPAPVAKPDTEMEMTMGNVAEKGSRVVPNEPFVDHRVQIDAVKKRDIHFVETYHSVTAMLEYENHSFEELRIADVALYPAEATVDQDAGASSSTSSFSSFTLASFPNAVPLPCGSWSPLSPFPLYSDAIQAIMRYLSVNELLSSMRASKQWYQTLKTANSLGITSHAKPFALARMPANSVIARHIAQGAYLNPAIQSSHNLAFESFTLFPFLEMLLPNLKCLEISPIQGIETYSLPPHLDTVLLAATYPCNQLIKCLGQLKQLRELTLRLHAPLADLSSFDYSPLIALTQLEKVVVKLSHQVEIKHLASLATFIRHSRIRDFSFNANNSSVNPICIYFLTPTPEESTFPLMESGNLTSIDFPNMVLDGNMLRVLWRYPSLNKLAPRSVTLSGTEMQLLAKFPNLTEFTFPPAHRSDEVVAVCKYLPNVRKLHMKVHQINAQSLDESLSHLSRLTDLTVVSSINQSSIAHLVKYDLPKRLTKLKLTTLQLTVSDLRNYILPLQQLESLDLQGTISEEIPDELMIQLRTMPKMIECQIDFSVRNAFAFSKAANRSISTSSKIGGGVSQAPLAEGFNYDQWAGFGVGVASTSAVAANTTAAATGPRTSFGFVDPSSVAATGPAPSTNAGFRAPSIVAAVPSSGFSFAAPPTVVSAAGFGWPPVQSSAGVSFGTAPAGSSREPAITQPSAAIGSNPSFLFSSGDSGPSPSFGFITPSTAAATPAPTGLTPSTGFSFAAPPTVVSAVGFGWPPVQSPAGVSFGTAPAGSNRG